MTEIDPRRVCEFMRLVFIRLWPESAGLPAREILMEIPQATTLTEFEREAYPFTHTPRYERAIRLATPPFVRAGWLVKSKGRWIMTETGKQALRSIPSGEAFCQETWRLSEEWQQDWARQGMITEEAEEMAWEQIHAFLLEMKPYDFQRLVGELLIAMGYHIAWAAPPEKNRGFVHFVIHPDPLGLGNPRTKVHISQRGQPVLYEGLRAFLPILGPEDAGIFISTGGFTASVKEQVQDLKSPRVTLMDLEQFTDLWVEYYDNLSNEGRKRFPLKPVYFLSI